MNVSSLFTTSWESGEIVMRSASDASILDRYTALNPHLQDRESTEIAHHLLDSVHTLLIKGKPTYINQPVDCDTSVLMASFHYILRSSDGVFKSHLDRTKKIRIGKNKTQKVINEIKDTFTHIVSEYEELYAFEGEFTLYDITIRLTPIQFTNQICLNRQTRLTKQRAGGSSSYAELPIVLKRLKCLLNIKNNDNMCLVWCILAHKFPKSINGTRVSVYKQHLNEIRFNNLDFPACLKDVDAFANANALNIRVWDLFMPVVTKEASPVKLSLLHETSNDEHERKLKFINLLLYSGHFILIKDLSALVRFTLNMSRQVFVCDYCGTCYFTTLKAYDNHLTVCMCYNEEFEYKLSEVSKVNFRNFKNRFNVPICIYADTESILEPVNTSFGKSSMYVNSHRAVALGYAIKSVGDDIREGTFYGLDCVDRFIAFLTTNVKHKAITLYNQMLQSGSQSYVKGNCDLCKFPLKKRSIVSSHACFKGETIKCHASRSVKIFFHNLKGYDSHFIIDQVAKVMPNLNVLLKSKEKGISMSSYHGNVKYTFLDSMSFLLGSLESLASRLTTFKWIGQEKKLSNLRLDHLKQYTGKQLFPYEYVTSLEVLENSELPKNSVDWYSKLKESGPSQEEVDGVVEKAARQGIGSLKEYMLFYLRIDVLLLLEVFEEFRLCSLRNYALDPCHYCTTPGLAWDAALKHTGQNLELLVKDDLVRFFSERGTIRGGVSTVSERKWACDDNNSSIMYYDVTNLYGYAMCHPLPIGDFSWVFPNESFCLDPLKLLLDWTFDSDWGYVYECDIKVPSELHDKYNELPFLPELHDGRLSATLMDKFNYRVHICVLAQAVRAGYIITKIHRILQFKQKAWLKPYIEFNTSMRAKTNDENERNFYKLMNNAVYGKTMENVFKRGKWVVIGKSEECRIQKMLRNSKVNCFDDFTENMLIGKHRKVPVFDKPVYIGFSILEISKTHMYFLLYDVIKVKWPKTKLMYMDTDSLIINFECAYGEIDYTGVEKYFDLSGYKHTNLASQYSPDNKGVLGTLKDEYPASRITKFVCLRSKCYSLELANGKKATKNKGDSNAKKLDCSLFEGILTGEITSQSCNQMNIRSFKHQVYTISMVKETINNAVDKKRVAVFNMHKSGKGVYETKAIGHYMLSSN